jgi:sporulation protein YlmC with PRC-barrel domain
VSGLAARPVPDPKQGEIMPQTKDAKGRFMQKVLAADTLTGDTVVNRQKEDLGKIEHLMIDVQTGRVAYAVLSFGGFLGMGDKLFAIPWSAL